MPSDMGAHAVNRFPAGPVLAMRKGIVALVNEAADQSLAHLATLQSSWPTLAQPSTRQSHSGGQRVAYEAFADRLGDVVRKIEMAFDAVFAEDDIKELVARLHHQTMLLALKGLRQMLNKAKRGLGDRIPPFRTGDWNHIHEGRVLANVQVIKGLGDWEKAQVARIITDGASRGVPYREVINQIKDVVEQAKVRAETIAINELNRTYNMITNDRYQAIGIKRAIWVTARDERVCPICAPLNGKVFLVNDLAQDGKPPEHPRCRCTTISHPEDVRALK